MSSSRIAETEDDVEGGGDSVSTNTEVDASANVMKIIPEGSVKRQISRINSVSSIKGNRMSVIANFHM